MVYVAREMERRGMDTPLLIGGATTSRIHTAVKIDPKYSGPVIYVLDASKSVPVASNLLNSQKVEGYIAEHKSEYRDLRDDHASRQLAKEMLPYAQAKGNRFSTNWTETTVIKPSFLGVKVYDKFSIQDLIDYIDWTPFFHAWEMKGRYPAIFDNNTYEGGEAAF
jgi:5-methyltetrahydrofolate--homocysteine methyltransferase